MKYLNSQTLGAVSWISVFGLSWLMLLDIVPITGLSIVLFMFYLATGLFASAYHAAQEDKMRKMYDELYKRRNEFLGLVKDKKSEDKGQESNADAI